MADETVFNVDVSMLFGYVNRARAENGLHPVEPAVMAVRTSIKFMVGGHAPVNLRTARRLDLTERDTARLCGILGSLFNVELEVQSGNSNTLRIMSPSTAAAGVVTLLRTREREGDAALVRAGPGAQPALTNADGTHLPLVQFYAAVNRARRDASLEPVEPAIIAVRSGVKFAILRQRPLRVEGDHMVLQEGDGAVLEKVVSQLFGVQVSQGVAALCDRPGQEPEEGVGSGRGGGDRVGFLSRILARFGVRRREPSSEVLDVNSLVLAILRQRAVMGHKPLPPAAIRSRCTRALASELGVEADPHASELILTRAQSDAFAKIVRREFQILFADLPALVARTGDMDIDHH